MKGSKMNYFEEKLSPRDIAVIERINNTDHVLTDKYLPERIHDAIAGNKNKTAVITSDREYSFLELGDDINAASAFLKSKNMGRGTTAALMFRKSYAQLVSALSVTYCGAAYTPIEYDLPAERIAESLESSGASMLITDSFTRSRLEGEKGFENIDIFEWHEVIKEKASYIPPAMAEGDDVFAVIFTSGSTGKPKGVKVTFENMRNCIEYTTDYIEISEKTRIISVINFCHDMNIYELFGVIVEGGSVVIPDTDKEKEPSHWIEIINKYSVNMWESVPTLISLLLLEAEKNGDVMPSLEKIILGGEFVPIETIRKIKIHCPNAVSHTIGGPTETTIWNIMHRVEDDDLLKSIIPYGVPIWNTKYYILDEKLDIVPIGKTGVIYNSGACVTAGYTEKALTDERYIIHPRLNVRMYNTGDLGRYNEKGYIEILGRADTQVKINGKRIELEGIENRMLENDAVRHAAAVAHSGHITAFCTLNESKLSEKNVDNWSKVFNDTYSSYRDDTVNENEDFSGWFSSYDHKPIPLEEMQNWRDDTVNRINSIKGKRIFEIGCGTGLLLHKLAPHADKYIGIDISDVAVNNLKKEIEKEGIKNTEVYCGAADKLEPYMDMSFDTIIINSVIFFFNNTDYLLNVIKNCAEMLIDGGCLFIGDIIDNDLARLFNSSVVLYNRGELSDQQALEKIRERMKYTKDLLVSRQFFKDVTKTVDAFSSVKICAKESEYINELTKFRYDAFLFKNKQHDEHEKVTFDASADEISENDIRAVIDRGKNVVIHNAVNKCLAEDYISFCGLQGADSGISQEELKNSHIPAYYYAFAYDRGYECAVECSENGRMDIYMGRDIYSDTENAVSIYDDPDKYTNVPYEENINADIAEQIKESLMKKLPSYMIPEEIVIMDQLPLLKNGKIDRKKLTALAAKNKSYEVKKKFTGDVEQFILDLYTELLGTDKIDKKASFFIIGGHSLLAMQLLTRIMKETHVNIKLSEFMKEPSMEYLISAVKERYDNESSKADTDEYYIEDTDHLYDEFPLNDIQRSYYYGRNSLKLGGVPTAMYLEFDADDLDMEMFERTVNRLVERHEMLRCVISGENAQRIIDSPPYIKVQAEDYSQTDSADEINIISDNICAEIFDDMIDLSVFPAFRIRVLKFAENKYRIFAVFDSTFTDGASLSILIDDFYKIYNNIEPPVLSSNFRDYCAACDRKRQSTEYRLSCEYWEKRADSLPAAAEIPVLNENGTGEKGTVRKEYYVSAERWGRIKEIAAENSLSIFSVQAMLYALVISRWSGITHFVMNIPVFNRTLFNDDIMDMVGEFGSLVLLEVNIDPSEGFIENCRRLQRQFEDDMDNRDAGGVELIGKLARRDGKGFPIVFTSLSTPSGENSIYDQKTKLRRWRSQSSQVWIDSIVFDKYGGIEIAWDCCKNVIDDNVLDDMFEAYIKCYEYAADTGSPIYKKLDGALNGRNYQTVLNINKTEKESPSSAKLLHGGFIQSLQHNKDKAAVITSQRTFTYGEIYNAAAGVAKKLRETGAKKGEHIGIYLEKGWKQAAAVLGVLFAEMVYVPLSKRWPEERINDVIDSADIKALVCNGEMPFKTNISVLSIEEDDCSLASDDFAVNIEQSGSDAAYVIFTSGSTGKPKGVVIEHQAAVNTLVTVNRKFEISENDRTFMLSELYFDLSVYDIFGIFYAGGGVVIPSAEEKGEPGCWSKLISSKAVTVWNTVPALMQMLADINNTEKQSESVLRKVLLSGDWIPLELPERIKTMFENADVISLGGATEASVWSNYYIVDHTDSSWTSIPYGYPLDNQQMYVLDKQMKICPENTPGNIYIGGKGVAREYLNDSKLTNEKFVYSSEYNNRLYFTGDKGQYRPDGSIEFLGRIDDQVKINGFRIELGEIEAAAAKCSNIINSAAVVYKTNVNKIALCYTCGSDIKAEDIVNTLEGLLPSYEMPSFYLPVEEIRLTANGKIDRKYLSMLALEHERNNRSNTDTVKAADKTESKLSEIFEEILNVPNITTADDFFELGGNSITVMRLIANIKKAFGREVTVSDIFENSDVRGLADIIKHTDSDSSGNSAKLSNDTGRIPLSSSQMGVWLDCLAGRSRENLIAFTMDIKGDIDVSRLERAINRTVKYFPAVRAVFDVDENYDVYQHIADFEEEILEFDDISSESDKNEVLDIYSDGFKGMDEEFDPEKGHLYRFLLVKLSDREYKLFAAFHHIICDDISIRAFTDKMKGSYFSDADEQNTETGFIDYCFSENKELSQEEKNSWKQKEDIITLGDISAFESGEKDGGMYRFSLDKEKAEMLKRLCLKNKATISTGFLAVFIRTLSSFTGSENISVGIPVSMRGEKNSGSFGMYVNMCLIADKLDLSQEIGEYLSEKSKDMFKLISGEARPFSDIVNEMGWDQDMKRIPFRFTYNYLGGESLNNGDEVFGKVDYIYDPYIHDFGLVVEFNGKGYDCTVTGKPGLVSYSKTERFAKEFEKALMCSF